MRQEWKEVYQLFAIPSWPLSQPFLAWCYLEPSTVACHRETLSTFARTADLPINPGGFIDASFEIVREHCQAWCESRCESTAIVALDTDQLRFSRREYFFAVSGRCTVG